MLIYTHNTPEKLQAVASSKEYIKENTDFCDLVDDPTIGIDVDFAINYKKAISGDPQSIESFIDSLILSGYALDAHTLNYYVTNIRNNPVTFGYIKNSTNKSSNFIGRDCLNSPCNYFAPVSNNIGTLADVASTLNYNTIPVLSLTAIPAAFSMSMATLGKIPLSIQESMGELTQLTTDTFKIVANIFNDDPENVKAQEDAIKSGRSYRSSSIGDIYTSDYRHYMDVSVAASDILANIASTMGNCFRLYQYHHRYNPFDYEMNQTGSSKLGVTRKIETSFSNTGYNGVNRTNEGDYVKSSTEYTTSVEGGVEVTPLRGDLVGTVKKMAVTIFGGYYNEQTKILYSTSHTDKGPSKEYTDAGVTASRFLTTPASERVLVSKLKSGWKPTNKPLPRVEGKFNMGFAIGKLAVFEYFKSVGVDTNIASRARAKCELEAIIKLNGATHRLPQIDVGPNFEYTRGGSSTKYRVIDITADAALLLFGIDIKGKTTTPGSVDVNYVKTIINAVHSGSNTVQRGLAEVQLCIPGVYEPDTPSISSNISKSGDSVTVDASGTPSLELPSFEDNSLRPELVSAGVLPSIDGSDNIEAVDIILD